MRKRPPRGLLLVSGVAGVVVAHIAAYVLAIPDGARRAQYLASTGHGYWSIAVRLATGAGVVSILVSGLRGRALARMETLGVGRLSAAALIAWQVGMFAAMEVSERIGSGSPVSGLMREPAFLVGVGIQVVVALLLAKALQAIETGVRRLVTARQDRSPRVEVVPRGRRGAGWVGEGWIGGQPGARGPPLLALD